MSTGLTAVSAPPAPAPWAPSTGSACPATWWKTARTSVRPSATAPTSSCSSVKVSGGGRPAPRCAGAGGQRVPERGRGGVLRSHGVGDRQQVQCWSMVGASPRTEQVLPRGRYAGPPAGHGTSSPWVLQLPSLCTAHPSVCTPLIPEFTSMVHKRPGNGRVSASRPDERRPCIKGIRNFQDQLLKHI